MDVQCTPKLKPANMTCDEENTLTSKHLRPPQCTVCAVVRELISSHIFLPFRIYLTQTPTHAIKAEPTIKRSLGLHTKLLAKLTLKQKTIAAPKSMSSEIVVSQAIHICALHQYWHHRNKNNAFYHLQCEWT